MTMQERIDAAKAAMTKIHAGIAQALDGSADLLALDTPENVAGLDEKDVRALRREAQKLARVLERASDEADDVHTAMNEIGLGSDVIAPYFGKRRAQ